MIKMRAPVMSARNALVIANGRTRILPILLCVLLPWPAYAADDLLNKAIRCSDFDDCFNVMLQASDPRQPEAINVAAARIGEIGKPPKGNRKAARELNARGLSEYKKGHISEAVALMQQAANEDPSDVEVQSNLGLILLKANRSEDAKLPLKTSLTINPRRTSAWVPMAELFFEIGDSAKAVSSLMLAYEFSENKERTRTYFEGKSGTADRNATIYTTALKKVNEPRPKMQASADEVSKNSPSRSITRNEARAIVIEKLNADAELRNDPLRKEVTLCALNPALDETFRNATELDAPTFERRVVATMESMKTAMERKDPELMLRLLKCLVNAGALEQAMKDKGEQDRQPLTSGPTPTVPSIDMDDLKLDMAALDGRRVRVRGFGFYMMDMFMLKKSMSDLSPILVDTSRLSRDQRRHIIQQCGNIMSGCQVTVIGTVGKVTFQSGILAEKVEW